ncbi:L-lactate transporter [Candidatus Entotheonellaceae bacterium PAL068K]
MIHAAPRRGQNAYRWIVLTVAFAIAFMTTGTRATLGVFLKTIIEELHWDRGTISMVIAINIWLGGLLQPFAGYVMDRFGAKWLFTASLGVYALGVGLTGLTQSVVYFLVIYGILLAVATAGSSISLSNALVAQWFSDRRRGLAIGLNNVGAAVGQLSLVPLSALMLTAMGWRLSYLYLGLAVAVTTVPLALLIPRRHTQADRGTGSAERPRGTQGPLTVQRWSNALYSPPLWQLMGGYFVCGMTVSLYYTHLIPFATDRGFSSAIAVTTFSLLVACSAVGALVAGVISDRIGRKNVLALAYCVRATAFAVLLLWQHELALYGFAILGGLSWLATPGSVTALTGEVYGMRTLGTLSGISLAVHQVGGGASVWLAGVLYDVTGSYNISFILALIALLGAALVSFGISERRYSVRYLTTMPTPVAD